MSSDLAFLSQKRTLLANPGTKLDSIYYSAINTTVELSEATYNNGRFSSSLSTKNFGSQSQVIIPNSSLLSDVYLHLELPAIVVNQTITRGWGYAAIESISYLFGSSNVSQISISGQTMLQTLFGQAETEEKKSEMFRLAGDEQIAPTTAIIQADVMLGLPFSTASGLFSKLPFDTNLLSNPITISIKFNRAESIYGGAAIPLQGFTEAIVLTRQGDLTNKDQSLKFELMKNPALMYAYPFIHHQDFTPAQFQGKLLSSNPVNVTLQSFINADLVGISLGVIEQTRLTSSVDRSPSPFAYDAIQDIQLKFNGLLMYDAPGEIFKLYNMSSMTGSSNFHNSVIADKAGGVAPFTSDPVDTYIVYIDFSRIRSLTYEGAYQNVWRIGNNTLTLTFTTTTTNNYSLFASYHYNGVAEVQNGTTAIFFD